ncbi:MAG: phosphopantothenoylcysteine decarboxylase [Elusimicrobiaceae bacterium]|jgi:phosphopantothenoylcysteine decarboxylase/phosphopantothenate--cysteine ligase
MKILITAGATREPIDGVRFITNFSTGKTGADMTDCFRQGGHGVLYLHGINACMPKRKGPSLCFEGFADLDGKLRLLLKKNRFDIIVHAAAVGDYSIRAIVIGNKACRPNTKVKIHSKNELVIKLKKNFKILNKLAIYASPRKPTIVGFKLTCRAESDEAKYSAPADLSLRPCVDVVVHNDLLDMRNGKRIFRFYEKGCLAGTSKNIPGLVRWLTSRFSRERKSQSTLK